MNLIGLMLSIILPFSTCITQLNINFCYFLNNFFTIRYILFTFNFSYRTIEFMGKCKKRTLRSGNDTYFMTREKAVNDIFELFSEKKNVDIQKAKDLITLFGISAEELGEAGLPYEILKSLGTAIE